jgi:endonuclease/exonuclease/phosphatase family metal-dependent hydrolase
MQSSPPSPDRAAKQTSIAAIAATAATDWVRVVHALKAQKPYILTCCAVPPIRVLSWNLFHGRALPPHRRPLLDAFAAKLGEWDWDVALLQEVPPWWAQSLASSVGAEQRSALTSRNSLLAPRRALAERRPELLKSNGGGCNAVLSRLPIVAGEALRLRSWPERRVAQLLRLGDGTCVVNFHASTRPARAASELERLWKRALEYAGAAPLILGGDLNLREPDAPRGEIAHVAAHDVDHGFARGPLAGQAQTLDRRIVREGRRVELSDHAPLQVELRARS